MTKISAKTRRVRLDPESYSRLHRQVMDRDDWRCKSAEQCKIFKCTTYGFEVDRVETMKRI